MAEQVANPKDIGSPGSKTGNRDAREQKIQSSVEFKLLQKLHTLADR
jgi:hypothetical protein